MKKINWPIFLIVLSLFTLPANAQSSPQSQDVPTFPPGGGTGFAPPPPPPSPNPPIIEFPSPSEPQPVPEPTSVLGLLAVGALGIGLKFRPRQSRKK